MPAVNTSAAGASLSCSDVMSVGLGVVVASNNMSNVYAVRNVPNFLICGGYVQTLSTQFYCTQTHCGGSGIASGTNSGKGMHLMASTKLIVRGSGASYHGCYGTANSGNTVCVQQAPSQCKVYVSC